MAEATSSPATETLPAISRWKAPDNSLQASLLLAFLSSAGLYYVNIFPAITNALMEGAGLSTVDAGQITSANAMGAACGALTVTLLIRLIPHWKMASVALLFGLICMDMVTIAQESADILVPLRFGHGFIGGSLVGLGFSVIARTERPSVAFSLLLVVQYGGGALGLWLLPPLVPAYGPYVPFYALIIFCVITLCMVPFLAAYPLPSRKAKGGKTDSATAKIRVFPLGLTLLALFLFQAANMALFAFIFGLGKHYSLTVDFMSPAIAVANIVAIGGAVLAAYTGIKFKLLKPLLLALLCSGLATCLFLFSESQAIYLLANCITGFAWAFSVPYFLTMSARFDAAGQMAALGGFASKMGLACGPMVAGYVLSSEGSYPLLVVIAVAVIAACLAIAYYPARDLDGSGAHGSNSM
jgi:predicted MFS family arabinose efflux permease